MKREFADDPMMGELHDIRAKHDQEATSSPATAQPRRRARRIAKLLSAYGYQLVPTKRGTRRLVSSAH